MLREKFLETLNLWRRRTSVGATMHNLQVQGRLNLLSKMLQSVRGSTDKGLILQQIRKTWFSNEIFTSHNNICHIYLISINTNYLP